MRERQYYLQQFSVAGSWSVSILAAGRLSKLVLRFMDLTCVARLASCMILKEITSRDHLSTWTVLGSFWHKLGYSYCCSDCGFVGRLVYYWWLKYDSLSHMYTILFMAPAVSLESESPFCFVCVSYLYLGLSPMLSFYEILEILAQISMYSSPDTTFWCAPKKKWMAKTLHFGTFLDLKIFWGPSLHIEYGLNISGVKMKLCSFSMPAEILLLY